MRDERTENGANAASRPDQFGTITTFFLQLLSDLAADFLIMSAFKDDL